ncbi:MAG TPA: hypothetical protein VJZ91_02485 [Blastocatellia bacterium]|nr:hypothetical protein [Blastocatellia bacterium]
MKLAILCESPADAAAVRILVNAILGEPTEMTDDPLLSPRGWPAVLNVLPSVLKYLYYRTDADSLVVVVDADKSPVHEPDHDEPDSSLDQCKVCLLRTAIQQTEMGLKPVAGRLPIKTAIGLAVPAMEAWYLCGIEPQATEAALRLSPGASLREIKLHLKQAVYATSRPPLEHATARAVEEATRLAQDLELLEQLFPDGFGTLARDVRSW